MKTTILMSGAVLAVSFAAAGCAYRSPEMYRDDTKKVLDGKANDIKACYDGVVRTTPGAAGKVTVDFEVETEEGKITNVKVDKANTTAPDAVSECVTKNLAGLVVAPPDKRLGQAKAVWEFSVPKA